MLDRDAILNVVDLKPEVVESLNGADRFTSEC